MSNIRRFQSTLTQNGVKTPKLTNAQNAISLGATGPSTSFLAGFDVSSLTLTVTNPIGSAAYSGVFSIPYSFANLPTPFVVRASDRVQLHLALMSFNSFNSPAFLSESYSLQTSIRATDGTTYTQPLAPPGRTISSWGGNLVYYASFAAGQTSATVTATLQALLLVQPGPNS